MSGSTVADGGKKFRSAVGTKSRKSGRNPRPTLWRVAHPLPLNWACAFRHVHGDNTTIALHSEVIKPGCPTLCAFCKGWGTLPLMPRNLKRYVGRRELHFITFSCYQRRALLRSARVKQRFIKILAETRKRYGFRLIGYVL